MVGNTIVFRLLVALGQRIVSRAAPTRPLGRPAAGVAG